MKYLLVKFLLLGIALMTPSLYDAHAQPRGLVVTGSASGFLGITGSFSTNLDPNTGNVTTEATGPDPQPANIPPAILPPSQFCPNRTVDVGFVGNADQAKGAVAIEVVLYLIDSWLNYLATPPPDRDQIAKGTDARDY